MLKIVGKEWLATRWLSLACLAGFALYSLQPYFAGGMIVFIGSALVLANLMIGFFIEDRTKTEILYLSLPVGRNAIVGARHLYGIIWVVAAGAVIFGLIGPVSDALRPGRPGPDPFPLLTIEAAAVFAVFSAILTSLYLSFYHRFGFGRGTSLFAITCVLLISVLVVGAVAAFPDDFDLKKNAVGAKTLFGALHSLRLSLGTPLFVLAAAVLFVVPFLVSWRLSRRFYARREF